MENMRTELYKVIIKLFLITLKLTAVVHLRVCFKLREIYKSSRIYICKWKQRMIILK